MSGTAVRNGKMRGKGLARKYKDLEELAALYGSEEYDIYTIVQPDGNKILVLDMLDVQEGDWNDGAKRN